jgi:lipopolysaccharide export system protein LptA
MSKLFIIVNLLFVICLIHSPVSGSSLLKEEDKKPIVITSETLTADNKNQTATFEGSVVATTGEISIQSDKMVVYYDNSENKVSKIHALGNVKVNKEEQAIFSDEAMYLDNEQKIVFSGNPKAVEGENLITGKQIIFFLKEDRAVIEGSKLILQNSEGLNKDLK